MSKNHNCLEGIACPKCKQEDVFSIVTTCKALVHDDGIEGTNRHEWNSNASITCRECMYSGTVAEFSGVPAAPVIPEERMGVLSTAHVSYEESLLIPVLLASGALIGMEREEGWLVHTSKPMTMHLTWPTSRVTCRAKGFSGSSSTETLLELRFFPPLTGND